MYMLVDLCSGGLGTVFKMIKIGLNVIRFVVPIGLIIMTVIDVSKNVFNPDEKDTMKKIGTRLIAAIIVFLVPTIINLLFKVIEVGVGDDYKNGDNLNIFECWESAGK